MKKSVKILIVVLCLIIVGLVTFIVVDKLINKKVETQNNDESNVVNAISNSNDDNNTTSVNETNFKSSDFYGDWNNDEDTQLTVNSDGTFQADHYTASSTIYGDYTINGDKIEFVCKKDDSTYNKKWSGQISKDTSGKYTLKVNLYDQERTLYKVRNNTGNEEQYNNDKSNKAIESAEDIRIVADYDYVSSTSGYMKITAFDLDSNVVWTYKTETIEGFEYLYRLDWYHTNRAYITKEKGITVLDALNGSVIGNCEFSKINENDTYQEVLATSVNTEKGYYYALVRHFYDATGKDIVYKIDNSGNIVGSGDIIDDYGTQTVYEIFSQGASITEMHIDSSEKVLTCTIGSEEGGSEEKIFDINFE